VRRAATYALGKIGPEAKAALAAIQANADNEELRPVSLWAMVLISPQDAEIVAKAVPALAAALRREQPIVRFEAAQALGKIGPPAVAALPALEALGEDPDMHVRNAAAAAIQKIKGS